MNTLLMRSWILSLCSVFLATMTFVFIGANFGNTYALSTNCKVPSTGVLITTAPPAGDPIIDEFPACTSLDTGAMGFKIPSLGDLLTFAIRVFFVIAGLAALFYMILGAFAWITSGGDKDSITAARDKIQAAVIGMILIVAVLAIIWTLEQVIFNRRICLGLSCPLTLPGLLNRTNEGDYCCVCVDKDGKRVDLINTSKAACNPADGTGVAR